MFKKTLPRYRGYLELHANRTLWSIDSECDKCDDFTEIYNMFVNDAIAIFENQTGTELFCLGRSGRHICVKDTYENSRKYRYLQSKALELEKQVIADCNNL